MVAFSPHSNPIPSISTTLLLPSSRQIQVVNLGDGGTSESESMESDEVKKEVSRVEKSCKAEKVSQASKIIPPTPKNPFSLAAKTMTPFRRKMFSVDTLGTLSQVIGIETWLEDTLDRKRKRKEEGLLNKETLSLDINFKSILSKVKKKKTFSILGQEPDIGHLTMDIVKPTKEVKLKDLTIEDFSL